MEWSGVEGRGRGTWGCYALLPRYILGHDLGWREVGGGRVGRQAGKWHAGTLRGPENDAVCIPNGCWEFYLDTCSIFSCFIHFSQIKVVCDDYLFDFRLFDAFLKLWE